MFLSWNSTFFQKVWANLESILPQCYSPQYRSSNIFCVHFPELRLKPQRSCEQQVMTVALFGQVFSPGQLGVVPSNLAEPQGQWDSLCCSLPLLWMLVGTTEQRQLKHSFTSLAHLLKFSVISTLIAVGSSYFPKSYCSIPMIFKAESLT